MTETAQAGAPIDIDAVLQDFLLRKTHRHWQTEEDLFATGVVSSLFAMELVVFVESTFGVEVEGPDLKIDNFRTVASIRALVELLREHHVDA